MKQMTQFSAILICVCLLAGCSGSEVEKRRLHSLDRLNWTGGRPEDRYVRDSLVTALQKVTPKSLDSPTLVNASFRGKADQKIGLIVVHWISAQPLANGLLLNMQDGSSLSCTFHSAYLEENEKESKDLAVFQAAVGDKSNPHEWQQIKLQAIDSVQLTKDGAPVGNVCKFRLHQKEKSGQQENAPDKE